MRHSLVLLFCLFLCLPGCANPDKENGRLKEEMRMLREENGYLKAEVVGLKKELDELNAKMKEERGAFEERLRTERQGLKQELLDAQNKKKNGNNGKSRLEGASDNAGPRTPGDGEGQ